MRENDLNIFVPSDLDLWPLDLEFAAFVTLIPRYFSTKLEVSKAVLLWENQRHGTGQRDGRTDGMQLIRLL